MVHLNSCMENLTPAMYKVGRLRSTRCESMDFRAQMQSGWSYSTDVAQRLNGQGNVIGIQKMSVISKKGTDCCRATACGRVARCDHLITSSVN